MKTITYRGRKYIVEDWVKFVAMDYDGCIYGYENKPEHGGVNWIFATGRACYIGIEPADWENSLEEV